jgi:peptidyl-prolyl cis-trans isomerase-like 4
LFFAESVVLGRMSVLLNTSAGDMVIDLFTDSCPLTAINFVKLCQLKYYNNCLFYNVQQNFIAQTGDPTGTGKGGSSVYGIINGNSANNFADEIVKSRKVNKIGLVGMAHTAGKENSNRSQFFITLRGEDMEQFEGTHTFFGEVAEGMDVLEKINALYCDEEGRPYQDVRILHTYVLDDPFPDPPGMPSVPASPERLYPEEELVKRRLPYQEGIDEDADGKTAQELDESIRRKEAKSRAIVLEMTGDLPDADVKPPVEVLFVCKLNPVTTDEDLELIFSRFGTIKSCEVIRDFKTGESLNYAFIEYETEASCIEAYEKMNNVLIDDRRIKVDFSQSVSTLWNRFLLQPRTDGSANAAASGGRGGSHALKSKPIVDSKPSHYMRQPPGTSTSASNTAPYVKHEPRQHNHRGQEDRGNNGRDGRTSADSSYRGTVKSESGDRTNDRHRSSDRDRNGERDHERERERVRDKDSCRGKDAKDSRDRDRDRDRPYDRERDSQRERRSSSRGRGRGAGTSGSDRGRDKDRDRERSRSRDRRNVSRDADRERDSHRDREGDRDKNRNRDRSDRDHRHKNHRD